MPDRVALVIGPTGATGGPIAAALARHQGWRVYGMSRSAPSDKTSFTHLAADLTDLGSCRRALAGIRQNGYCISRDEMTEGNSSVAAPIRDGSNRVVASVSVVVPSRTRNLTPLVPVVRFAALGVSRAISSRHPADGEPYFSVQ